MTLTGDNGLLNRTTAAKKKTEEAGIMEQIRLAYQNALIGEYTKKYDNTEKTIAEQIEEDLKAIYGNGVQVGYENGVYTVTTPEGKYTIDENGNVSKKAGITIKREGIAVQSVTVQIVNGVAQAETIVAEVEGLEGEIEWGITEGPASEREKFEITTEESTEGNKRISTATITTGNDTAATTEDVTIRVSCGGESAICSAKIIRVVKVTSIESITTNATNGKIDIGSADATITATATVNEGATEELDWSVNDAYKDYITISEPNLEGDTQTVTITVSKEVPANLGNIELTAQNGESGEGKVTESINLTINFLVSGIKIKKTGETTYIDPTNPPEIKIAPSTGTVGLTAEVEPSTASNQNINWSIETTPASGVASLSGTTGSAITVSAGSTEGTATVTATSAGDSNKSVSVTINIEEIETEPNAPNVGKLTSKKYVTWTQSGSTYTRSEITTEPTKASDWYNYRNGQWANIKTEANGIPSYWVWIPRFAYKQSDLTGSIKQIDVKFVGTDVTSTNVSTSVGAGYAVHPAFTFGSDELEGFWVAKYEASAYNHTTDSNGGGNNTSYKAQSIPGVPSWRYISAENIFTVCQAMTESGGALNGIAETGVTIDSHMMKNSEWGAVAILSQSKYGVYNPTSLTLSAPKVWNNPNSSYITGNVGASAKASNTTSTTSYDSANGPKASTTGTVYGVYDMAGGAWEYVAGCYSNTEFGSGKNAKYYDTYNSSEQKTVLAITGWNGDYSYVVSESDPVFLRGGDYYYSTDAGVFASYSYDGGAYSDFSFRPVWVAP